MVDVDIYISSHLKEEPAWVVDIRLWVINTIMLFKNGNSTKELKELKNKAVLNLKQYYIRCYVALSDVSLFRDRFYCEVSSLANQAQLRCVSV